MYMCMCMCVNDPSQNMGVGRVQYSLVPVVGNSIAYCAKSQEIFVSHWWEIQLKELHCVC